MAEEGDFSTHDMPHIRIDSFRTPAQYVFPRTKREPAVLRKEPHEHAETLVSQLVAALGQIPAEDTRIAIAGHVLGANVEIETSAPATPRSGPVRTPDLDFPGQNIAVLRSRRREDRTETAVVFVPDNARDFLISRIDAYGSENLGNHRRPDVNRFEPIEEIRPAPVRTLFAQSVDFDSPDSSWWELWVTLPGLANAVETAAIQAGFDVHSDRLKFPETVVLFVWAVVAPLATFLNRIPGAIAEVRRASGTIQPFLELTGGITQHDWVADLAQRIEPPQEAAPAICVLDTGVSGGHPLIAPALAGAWAVDAAWGTGDDHPHGGHGTPMAGIVLHGDLFWRMNDSEPVTLTHHVESVKFLPPNGFPPTQPPSYGTITQAAISVAEIARPNAVRSFCIATSATDFAPDAPSSWSGALDQVSAGSMPGDRQENSAAKDHPKRLVLVASGNAPGGPKAEVIGHHSIEDPAQSWNALTIGGYTAKNVGPADEPHLVPLVGANEKSPFSCGSQNLVGDLTPIKPEVLFEAGNMLVDHTDICDWHPAVSLLGTGSEVAVEPLVPFWATSAASAVAGNFLGQLCSALPGLWPETYRALIVQSAEWPTPIRSRFIGRGAHWKTTGGKAAKQLLLRDVGYGVPNLPRAIASARSDLTLLAQAEIKPFTMGQGTAIFNEVHFYALPWPQGALEAMENEVVTMKITLSYFIEPNLTGRAATRPDTYRSFGLRFDLKKRTEGVDDFRKRLSKQQTAPAEENGNAENDDGATGETSYWLLGPKAIQAGSLHCDIWRGHGIDLASHDHIAVYPVGGWWKSHLGQKRMEDTARYSLAVSITVEGQDIDLYSEVVAKVEAANIQAAAIGIEATPL